VKGAVLAYVHGPLDPDYGIPVSDLDEIRRHVIQVHKDRAPLSAAVAARVGRILYGMTAPPKSRQPPQRLDDQE
jgi:hypothetical protein